MVTLGVSQRRSLRRQMAGIRRAAGCDAGFIGNPRERLTRPITCRWADADIQDVAAFLKTLTDADAVPLLHDRVVAR